MAEIMAWPLNLEVYSYNAEDIMRWMAGKTSGIYGQEGNWQVEHKSGLTVTVKAENMLGGWLSNMGQYGVVFWSATDIDLNVRIGDGTNPRIDRVIVSWHLPNQSELPVVEVRQGTPAAEPVPPEIVNDGEYVEVCLAEITVEAGAVAISAKDIKDTRLDETLCGIVSMGVEKYPTGGLDAEFRAWFEDLKIELGGDVATNLQNQIDELEDRVNSRPRVGTGTARLEDWTGSPLQNVVSIPGVKPAEECDVLVGLDGDKAGESERAIARASEISPVAQDTDTVTLVAEGSAPIADLPIVAFIFDK